MKQVLNYCHSPLWNMIARTPDVDLPLHTQRLLLAWRHALHNEWLLPEPRDSAAIRLKQRSWWFVACLKMLLFQIIKLRISQLALCFWTF